MLAARRAARQVLELTGHEPENVVSIERDPDGWQVGVEVLELHRVPETTDVLAVYDVTLDDHGELIRCQRGQRYIRASAGPQE
jgi:Gas vesicle synthesis protein GvpO